MQKMSLVQKHQHRLKMTNELRQAINLLQYSSTDLATFIHEKSLENPYIELEDPTNRFNEYDHSYSNSSTTDFDPIYAIKDEDESLTHYLEDQLISDDLSKMVIEILMYMIQLLDEDGYFRSNVQEVAEHFCISVSEVHDYLTMIQRLEPRGVGATTLEECLCLQLDDTNEMNQLTKKLICTYLNEIAKEEYDLIAKELKIEVEDIFESVELIKTLKPKPGLQFSKHKHVQYIVPDIYVSVQNHTVLIELNDQLLPKITLSKEIDHVVKESQDQETIDYLDKSYDEALWLIKSLSKRNSTLLKISKAIIEWQEEYIVYAIGHLKPLKLADIAELVNVHVSTVSRTVRNKYIQTPSGIVELKEFFTNAVSQTKGHKTSSHTMRKMIRELIDLEDRDVPLSDQQLTNELTNRGYGISRRTVAKYRSQLKIAPAKDRTTRIKA